ncbi:MAG: hypothetical protein QOC81_1156 [Thermoanaerobaculia bacterium]|nr:hypothetical protein [Thermoanaerobaculia bacterium]
MFRVHTFSAAASVFAAIVALSSLPAAAQNADLGITKRADFPAYAGENYVYRLDVVNNGPSAATTVTVTDALPAGLQYQGVDAPGFTCTTPAVGANGTVTCTAASMASGATVSIYLFAGIPSGTAGGTAFANTANISSSNADPVPGNNSSTVTFTVSSGAAPASNMSVTKTAPTTAVAGTNITYHIEFGSFASTKSNVVVTDTLPAGTTFQSFTPPNAPGFTCTLPPVGSGGTIQCTTPFMFNNLFHTIDIVVAVSPSLSAGTVITNTASASSTTPDPDPTNNSSSAATTVSSPTGADLGITKRADVPAYAGENYVYRLDVVNNGPSAATTVTVTDALPAGLLYEGVDAPGFTCTTPAVGANGTVTCTTASMASGATVSIYLFAGIPSGTAGGTVFANTANTSSSNADPVPGNNSSTATFTVSSGAAPSSNMSATKTAPTTAVAGTNITYHIEFGSFASTKSNVVVTDTLPAGTTFQSITQPNAPGFRCTTPPVGSAGTIQCTTPFMFNNLFHTIDIVVAVSPAPAGTVITNTASASSTTPDPDPTNNSASAATVIVAAPDLTINKTHAGSFVQGQTGAIYTLTVTNTGNGPTTGTVTVTDTLPSGLTATAMGGTGWTCSMISLTCTRNDALAAGSSYPPITLTVNVAFNAPPSVMNRADVSGGGEFVTANDSATDTTLINQAVPAVQPLALLLLAISLIAIAAFRTVR